MFCRYMGFDPLEEERLWASTGHCQVCNSEMQNCAKMLKTQHLKKYALRL